ncbi:4-amino-4-deoxy-L-arabinose transferase and related glycosyltransferases of PMT family-like [Pseudomonas sp. SHC52]|nr:4-amino-4-deoxy-L-arabinose transferase and related glycosyltransferases of PMT family-like [Pseudomonas sp. SHC52]
MQAARRALDWPTLGVAVLLLLLFYWGLGSLPFLSVNEARRAVTTREMYESAQWLLPYMNGELYLSKPDLSLPNPPLFYWLALVSMSLSGSISEWSVRLPSALFATVCCLTLYRQARAFAGRQVALLAVMFLAANAGFSLFARRAEIEMPLTGLCLLALFCAWRFLFAQGGRSWVWLSYGLLGCALLTKGPVCLLWVTAPILVYALISRDRLARAFLCDSRGWMLAVLIGISWYLAVSMQEGWGVWSAIINEDIVKKINGQGAEAWYAYLLYLGGDFFPFWLILLVRPRQLWHAIRLSPQLTLLLCCILVPLLVFSLFTEKHAKYLLPVYPAIALLLAWHWSQLLTEARHPWWRWSLRVVPAVVLAGYTLFYLGLEGRVFAHRIDGFPQIKAATDAYPNFPAYSLGAADIRLVYYMGRPVSSITELEASSVAHTPGLLFVREPLPAALQALAPCTLTRIESYLRPKRSALLLGLGSLCANQGQIKP